MDQLTNHIYLYSDTCNVYIIREGDHAVLIDFGSGAILQALQEAGIRAEAILVTHHHRDQIQGLQLAAEAGIPVFVPHSEQELVSEAGQMWQAREIYNNYNNRQDRFSILESVPIAAT